MTVLGPAGSDLRDLVPCGYLATAPDGRVLEANATFCSWTGWTEDELRGRWLSELLTPGGRVVHEAHYVPLLRLRGTVRELALDLVRRDGSRLPALLNATADLDDRGAPVRVRIAVLDATERRRYERELLHATRAAEEAEERARGLARTLQQTFVPEVPPTVPGLEISGGYRPAGRGDVVGGDFHDVRRVGEDEWLAVLGDVCGKGAGAAALTALVRHTAPALAYAEPSPAAVLDQLHRVVRAHEADRFCTVVLVRLRREGPRWRATLSVGGHPPPYLLAAGAAPQPLDVVGSLIGLVDVTHHVDHTLVLEPGDALVLYTDGVTEARGADGMFGDERLAATLAELAAAGVADLVDGLVQRVVDYQGGHAHDDVAVLALRAAAGDD